MSKNTNPPKADKFLSLDALFADTPDNWWDAALDLHVPEHASLELLTTAREAILGYIDFETWHAQDPEVMTRDVGRATQRLIELSLRCRTAKSNSKDGARLKAHRELRQASLQKPKSGERPKKDPDMSFDDACPKCGSHDAYLDVINVTDKPKGASPEVRCCGCDRIWEEAP